MQAIRVHEFGGPEVLRVEEIPEPKAGAGEAVVAIAAVGVNYIDVYFRTGVYKVKPPFTPGLEAGGTVVSVGAGVTTVKVGDRVAYTSVPGAYAQFAAVPAQRLVVLPPGVTAKHGAAAMLQGMTAHYLAVSTRPLAPGDTCLVHAAAGGVGLLLCQIAKQRGARVIGTVSTEEKARLARQAGASDVILYSQGDFEPEVKRLTGGAGVDVVFDGVGKTTFDRGLACLKPRGLMVLYGQASGAVPPFDPQVLNAGGSLFLTRPKLDDYVRTREELVARATEVLRWAAEGSLQLRIEHELALADAAQAHRALEGRRTTGKILLIP
jgi:NADPH:quinone reductase